MPLAARATLALPSRGPSRGASPPESRVSNIVPTPGLAGGGRGAPPAAASPPPAPAPPLTVAADGVRLEVHADGRFTLYEARPSQAEGAGSVDRAVAAGVLSLPPGAAGAPLAARRGGGRGGGALLSLAWGAPGGGAPLAELTVTRPGDRPWCRGLPHALVLELAVRGGARGAAAEIALELEPSGHWFGGSHLIRQLWPLNAAALEMGPHYPFDNGPNGVNTLVGLHWVTSSGLAALVDPATPCLHVGLNAPKSPPGGGVRGRRRKWGVGIQNMNRELLPLRRAGDGLLRLQGRRSYDSGPMMHPLREWAHAGGGADGSLSESDDDEAATTSGSDADGFGGPEAAAAAAACSGSEDDAALEPAAAGGGTLRVRVALAACPDARAATMAALRTLRAPRGAPAAAAIAAPIWTSWARYGTAVDQAKVLRYAREVADRGLPRSVMEIDDRWQSRYGDLSFDARKFPDAAGMVAELHALGFAATAWVHPFVEERSDAYAEGAAAGYFVRGEARAGGLAAALPAWLGGRGARAPGGDRAFFPWWNASPVVALDVTNDDAVAWFVARLRRLQAETGLDGFKFDAGEPCFLPRRPVTAAPLATPAEYTRLYVERVAGAFAGGVSEVRAGYRSTGVALFTRMGDRFSTWSVANGLRSLIPTLLTSGVLGYPFCLPDMVGGNAYFAQRPDAELMVRWAQANALMPAVQFSIAPWDLGAEAEALVRAALGVRAALLGELHALAAAAAGSLEPICRPLWMLDAADDATFEVDDQFALGHDVVVAPVVRRGQTSRDVYIPAGTWRQLTPAGPGAPLEGRRWHVRVPAPLDTLPVFVRAHRADLIDGFAAAAAAV